MIDVSDESALISGSVLLEEIDNAVPIFWPSLETLQNLNILVVSDQKQAKGGLIEKIIRRPQMAVSQATFNSSPNRHNWEMLFSRKVSRIATDPGRISILDTSSLCRQISTFLQTQQPIWLALLDLKQLSAEIQALKHSVLRNNQDETGIRDARYLEIVAREKTAKDVSLGDGRMTFDQKRGAMGRILRFLFCNGGEQMSACRNPSLQSMLMSDFPILDDEDTPAKTRETVKSVFKKEQMHATRRKQAMYESARFLATTDTQDSDEYVKRTLRKLLPNLSPEMSPYPIVRQSSFGREEESGSHDSNNKGRLGLRQHLLSTLFSTDEAEELMRRLCREYGRTAHPPAHQVSTPQPEVPVRRPGQLPGDRLGANLNANPKASARLGFETDGKLKMPARSSSQWQLHSSPSADSFRASSTSPPSDLRRSRSGEPSLPSGERPPAAISNTPSELFPRTPGRSEVFPRTPGPSEVFPRTPAPSEVFPRTHSEVSEIASPSLTPLDRSSSPPPRYPPPATAVDESGNRGSASESLEREHELEADISLLAELLMRVQDFADGEAALFDLFRAHARRAQMTQAGSGDAAAVGGGGGGGPPGGNGSAARENLNGGRTGVPDVIHEEENESSLSSPISAAAPAAGAREAAAAAPGAAAPAVQVHSADDSDGGSDGVPLTRDGPAQARFAGLPICGPLGESPVHLCFLLGLSDTGRRMVDHFYTTPELVNVPYGNDLNPWRGCDPYAAAGGGGGQPGQLLAPTWRLDDGLYTGETCLHIAIVKGDASLVRFLLDRGADVHARAVGVFFQPTRVRIQVPRIRLLRALNDRRRRIAACIGGHPAAGSGLLASAPPGAEGASVHPVARAGMVASRGWWGRLFDAAQARFADGDPTLTWWELAAARMFDHRPKRGISVAHRTNEASGAYYGEFPLSFAVSTGKVAVCEMLYVYRRAAFAAAGCTPDLRRIVLEQLRMRDGALRGQWPRRQRSSEQKRSSVSSLAPAGVVAAMRGTNGSAQGRQGPGSGHVSEESDVSEGNSDDEDEEWDRTGLGAASLAGKKKVAVGSFFMRMFLNAMDSFGNTAMHLAVMHGRIDSIDWIMGRREGGECVGRESLEMLNFDGFTPVTLAARQGKLHVFRHLLHNYLSQIVWEFGKVQMRVTDLHQVDTYRILEAAVPAIEPSIAGVHRRSHSSLGSLFRRGGGRRWSTNSDAATGLRTRKARAVGLHGCPQWRSAVEIVVEYEVDAFSKDHLINKLIDDKWRRFGCRMYLIRTVSVHVLLLACFAAFVLFRVDEVRHDWDLLHPNSTASSDPYITERRSDTEVESEAVGIAAVAATCAVDSFTTRVRALVEEPNADLRVSRVGAAALEAVLAIFWGPWLVFYGWRHRRLGLRHLDIDEDGTFEAAEMHKFLYKNLQFLLRTTAGMALMMVGVCRVRCWDAAELDLAAAASVLLFANMLNVLVPFRYVGSLVITVYKMAVGDLARFIGVFLTLHCAFSFGMCLLCQQSADVEAMQGVDHPGTAFLNLAFLSLGDNISRFIFGLYVNTRSPGLTMALFAAWVIISAVLMLNLLVAMMAKTFQDDVEDTHRVWFFPYASLVLQYERGLSPAQRDRFRYGTQARKVHQNDTNDETAHFSVATHSEFRSWGRRQGAEDSETSSPDLRMYEVRIESVPDDRAQAPPPTSQAVAPRGGASSTADESAFRPEDLLRAVASVGQGLERVASEMGELRRRLETMHAPGREDH